MRHRVLLAVVSLFAAAPVAAQTKADTAAITAAALDYAEGWFEGNGVGVGDTAIIGE